MGGFDSTIEFYGEDVDIGRRAKKQGKVLFSPKFVMPTSGRRWRVRVLPKRPGSISSIISRSPFAANPRRTITSTFVKRNSALNADWRLH
jgi:hypothetical protein